jgi:hypothetical protein
MGQCPGRVWKAVIPAGALIERPSCCRRLHNGRRQGPTRLPPVARSVVRSSRTEATRGPRRAPSCVDHDSYEAWQTGKQSDCWRRFHDGPRQRSPHGKFYLSVNHIAEKNQPYNEGKGCQLKPTADAIRQIGVSEVGLLSLWTALPMQDDFD